MKQFSMKKAKIVTLVLNRPDKLNAISVQTRREIVDAIKKVNNDDDVLVLLR